MHTVRVFTNREGNFGNLLGVVIDESASLDKHKRQEIASKSGYSEVVFINDVETADINIYTPQTEIPFAGHALVGVAYFLKTKYSLDIKQVKGIKGVTDIWNENGITWVRGELSVAPSWNYEEVEDTSVVDTLKVEEMKIKEHIFVWSWINQEKGVIRARTFANDWGIPEDEANGSGAMKLAARLDRNLEIYHGKGSIIHARPFNKDSAEIGGLVKIID